MLDLTSRFQKLVAWKGLKIEIYCKLEKCWAWPKVYVGCKYTHLICILWRQQGGGPLEFHNIQEIVDIKLMFELIYMFVCFLSFYPHSKWSEKRKSTIKQEKVLNYYYIISYIVVKLMWTVAYFLISSSVIFRKYSYWMDVWAYLHVCFVFLSFYPHSKWSGKEEINSKTGESSKIITILLCHSKIHVSILWSVDQLSAHSGI